MLLEEFIDRSNVPDHFRAFVPLEVRSGKRSLIIRVAPDYLLVGTDGDSIRIPLNPLSAQKIADAWDCILPTKKIVDLIWNAGVIKLAPQPLPPTPAMTTVEWILRSNALIEGQLSKVESRVLGQLIVGHKKDVIITTGTATNPGKVAIYGWHQLDGVPIQQPNGFSHSATYADYSHGIRLIDARCVLDGNETIVENILADSQLSKMISDEGPIRKPRYRI
jgi:hypothetical protein